MYGLHAIDLLFVCLSGLVVVGVIIGVIVLVVSLTKNKRGYS